MDIKGCESFGFEYTVAVAAGDGRDSQTDLMLHSPSKAVAIEGKYTEPRYNTVSEWLGAAPSDNRTKVLDGWLRVINGATGAILQIPDVLGCTYQLIHRTASVCELPNKDSRAVVYQCFDASDAQCEYYLYQLSCLSALINKPEHLTFHLVCVGLEKTQEYVDLQTAWDAGQRNLSSEVRQGLLSNGLIKSTSILGSPGR
jgi:hypothetical protein